MLTSVWAVIEAAIADSPELIADAKAEYTAVKAFMASPTIKALEAAVKPAVTVTTTKAGTVVVEPST